MKRGDMIIAIVLAAAAVWLAFLLFAPGKEEPAGNYAKVMVEGKLYKMLALTEEEQQLKIETKRGLNILRVSKGGIEMIEADCSDQLCRGFGHIHRAREVIVCLPNRVVVEIVGNADDDGGGPDAVVF